ncbi:hypothetical protein OA067_01600 [Gammaproteobacteria bacterium]|nr:hypothetical protein [Gammaproteobacteria bacterium]
MKLSIMDENFLQIEQIRTREGILHSIWNFLEIPAKDLPKEHGLDQTHLILPPHFMSCWEPIDVDISSCFSWLDVWKKIDEEIGNKVEDYERFSPLSCYIEDFTVGSLLKPNDLEFEPEPHNLYVVLERGG